MYRENKYGEKVDVNKYECGSCKYYLSPIWTIGKGKKL